MQAHGHKVRFLASVTSLDEAAVAMAAGADLIDCKDPAAGALGALPAEVVREIAASLAHSMSNARLSATIGDVPADGGAWTDAARSMAAAGVDYVKIGMFPGGDVHAAIAEVGRARVGRARLVGVLLADRSPDLSTVSAMAAAGFAGVMLDTADKSGRSLTDVIPLDLIATFLDTAKASGLFAGLAGSLGLGHIGPLVALGPDVLGFRGALCEGHQRSAALDPERVHAVREALRAAEEARAALIAAIAGLRSSSA